MQTIQIRKFGKVLISRPAGLEAFNAVRPTLDPDEPVKVDFEGVLTVTPSWLDEFLTQLSEYLESDVELQIAENASVLAALPVLGSARRDRVAEIARRALERAGSTE